MFHIWKYCDDSQPYGFYYVGYFISDHLTTTMFGMFYQGLAPQSLLQLHISSQPARAITLTTTFIFTNVLTGISSCTQINQWRSITKHDVWYGYFLAKNFTYKSLQECVVLTSNVYIKFSPSTSTHVVYQLCLHTICFTHTACLNLFTTSPRVKKEMNPLLVGGFYSAQYAL